MRFRRSSPPPVPDGQSISANISGTVSNGQVAIGNANVQTQTVTTPVVTQAEREELQGMLESLRDQAIGDKVPREQRRAAMAQVDELEQATLADEPDVEKIQSVGEWFASNVPGMLGDVAGVLVHPIVGRIVGKSGELLVSQFQKHARA